MTTLCSQSVSFEFPRLRVYAVWQGFLGIEDRWQIACGAVAQPISTRDQVAVNRDTCKKAPNELRNSKDKEMPKTCLCGVSSRRGIRTRPTYVPLPNSFSSSEHTASVTSLVFELPPRSLVTMPRSVTFSTAFIIFLAASSSPNHFSISAAVQKVATGLATPFPVMSNAEP